MSKILVLAEKPSVGKDIAKVLGCSQKGNGFLEGPKYVVTWALGHLVTLADPDVYDSKYASWRLEDLPMLPGKLKLSVIKQTGKQFNQVRFLINRKDITEIIIATDAGREGELVARWIIEKVGTKKKLKRLWISSVTDKAIREGFQNLKPGKDYENLYAAAIARSEADWYVGINATRALTCKYNAQLSCGRVQTPTLAMIAKREEEIQNFKPKPFYGIIAEGENLKFTWQDQKSKETRIFDKEKADRIMAGLRNKEGQITEIKKNYKKSFSPKLYDLTELQRDANKIYGYSAKETLSIMQKLYEYHKILTYPRTDSRYISRDVVETLRDRIKACSVGEYSALGFRLLKTPIKANKDFVDDAKVSDHHAIIPTEQIVFLNALNDGEYKIYDLVVKRFLSVLSPPFEYEQTVVQLKIGGELFTAKGKRVIAAGWKSIYRNYSEESDAAESIKDQELPLLEKGEQIKIKELIQSSGKTHPPALFNEASLLSAMENPTAYMSGQDKSLIKIIGETKGIGTVATRADIMEKLLNSFLMEKKGQSISITSKGKQLLDLVAEDLKSPTLTAEWEQKLDQIAKGRLDKNVFIQEMKEYTKKIVKEVKDSKEAFRHDNMTRSKCPECGKYLLEVKGKKGKMLVCQDRECGYRKNLAKVTNARCPNCHKKLELRGEGDGQIFVCICGHREKLSAFQARRKKDQDKAGKQDVANYIKKQEKESKASTSSAMADALAKWKSK